MLDSLTGTIGFLTTIPVGRSDRLHDLKRRTYLFPVAGLLIGLITGLVAISLFWLIPGHPAFSGVLIIISIYLVTGIHHLDALSDFGDGLVAHGTREKKIKALKDVSLGTGGAAFIVLYLLLCLTILQSLGAMMNGVWLGVSLLVGEVAAKQSMLTVAWLGRPIHQGMGSMIADNTGIKEFSLGLLISAISSIIALGTAGSLALVSALLSSLVVTGLSNRHFGGINGDCIGTSNELGRLAALVSIFLIYNGGVEVWIPW